MRKILRRVAVHILIFIAGALGMAVLLNSETTDDRSDMNPPAFPEVMVEFGGVEANRMQGYAQPMQVDFMRECITPLDTTRKLVFLVNPYDADVRSLSYEIRSSDGSKVIENKKVKNLETSGNYLRAAVEITSDLRMNQEYSMQIVLETDSRQLYYYTRVISRANLNTEHYVQFVKSFYEKCMDKATADDLASYLEPGDPSLPTNFSNITITSSLSEISWGSLKPQLHKKGIPVIKDINETTASISIAYQISANSESGDLEIYDVTEFYRMRYTETRIRLLDFERSADQVFDPELPVISDDGLLLGVRDRNVVYTTNEENTIVAFIQQGDLWSYVPDNGKTVKIFSFRRDQNSDYRDFKGEHDIKIIRVGDNGDVDFVLYGYMNRGPHEGYCGVCVYHYNSDQNVVEERVFIPSTESYEFLNEDLGTLSYVNEENQLFLLLAGRLYLIDIDEGIYRILEENIRGEEFVISDTNAHAAWRVTEGDETGKIKMIDFDTRSMRIIAPENGQMLRTLGFMNEDLVYGVILDGDILTDANGHVTEGIHTILITAFDGTVKKEYHSEGLYVTDVSVEDTLMEFVLCEKAGSSYVYRKKDNIMNNKKAAAKRISIELVTGGRTGTRVRLSFEDPPGADDPLVVVAKMRNVDDREIGLDTRNPKGEMYYVYAMGGLDSTWQTPAQAVLRADERLGVVLNRAQQYVWERGNKKSQQQLNIEDVPEAMRSGEWNPDKLQEQLGDAGTVLDLSGCTLDSVLYEVSAQRPVIAKTGSASSVVIVGYDEYNTYLYNPSTGETAPYGMNDSTALFEGAGNIFISYMEPAEFSAGE